MLRTRIFAAAAITACILSAPALADPIDVLNGQYAFNWLTEPAKTRCVKVDAKLFADFKSPQYRCELTPKTNTNIGAPVRLCTGVKNKKEYLIFATQKQCNDERKAQASNE